MKEKILDAFKALGFELEELEGFGYRFDYEGNNYLLILNDDDEDFLNLVVPIIWHDYDEEKKPCTELIEEINSTLKYVKAYKMLESIWLVYERELIGEPDLTQVVGSMIIHLDAGISFLWNLKSKQDGDEENDTDDNKTEEE